jgi:hypothetical protein
MHCEQHDAHVRLARQTRTVFLIEAEPGKTVELRASWCVKPDKLAWAVLRFCEAARMEIDGTWKDDLARLEAALAKRN